jgi:uncharacterized protein
MDFDAYTITLLERRPDAPRLLGEEATRIQDGHLAHLASLNDVGKLLACGPLQDGRFAGLSILNATPDEALRLKAPDPAVCAGLFTVLAMPWTVPAGAIGFGPARFPRSVAEALS